MSYLRETWSEAVDWILWNPQVHDYVQKIPPLITILRKMTSVHMLTRYFLNVYFNIILYYMPRSLNGPLLSVFYWSLRTVTGTVTNIALLLRIPQILASILGLEAGYTGKVCSWFLSVPQGIR